MSRRRPAEGSRTTDEAGGPGVNWGEADDAELNLDEWIDGATPPRSDDARAAAFAEQMRVFRVFIDRVLTDAERAEAVAVSALASGLSERELRERAALVIRCQDCHGRVIAHVTWLDARPLLWTSQGRREPERSWLDDGTWGATAWCRVREYVLHYAMLRAATPLAGAAP